MFEMADRSVQATDLNSAANWHSALCPSRLSTLQRTRIARVNRVRFHFLLSWWRYRLMTVWYSCGRAVRSYVLEYLCRTVLSWECRSRSACRPIEDSAFVFLYSIFSSSVLLISTFSASARRERARGQCKSSSSSSAHHILSYCVAQSRGYFAF